MSLASRVSSLFTTTTTTPSDDAALSLSSTAVGGGIHNDEFAVSRRSKRARIMEDGEGGEELETRPPYLHVCFWWLIPVFAPRCGWSTGWNPGLLTYEIKVNASRRYRRHERRY